ncbi:CGNR zinc finger domain-containing protein [Streptomyces sp. NPDC059853]|uniref:CGNR zinc finger domain-containing protein n=1 Tax=Streptomyces sp. NPDC059853 TaxID=3346973 RepID=UPI0036590947
MPQQPDSAILIEAYANTLDLDAGTDALATPAGLTTWLAQHSLISGAKVTEDAHRSYLALRAGIREHLGAHVGDTPDPHLLAAADRALAEHPLHITADGTLTPGPDLPPDRVPFAHLAIAWHTLVTTGTAIRLKRCAEHTCGWVFWDASRSRTGRWCSMQVCGSRNKSRAYEARRRAPSAR